MSGQLHASAALAFLRGHTYPVLVEVWAKSITVTEQNTLKHNYKNQGIGSIMEAIAFVVSVKQTTFFILTQNTFILIN
jgi:hypothetical protein